MEPAGVMTIHPIVYTSYKDFADGKLIAEKPLAKIPLTSNASGYIFEGIRFALYQANFQGVLTAMKLHKPLSVFIQIILIGPLLWGSAEANQACNDLINPLHRQVNVVKDRGGMWTLFEKRTKLQNHSALALKVDSKIIGLMFTLDYLCTTLEGIPFNDVAEYIVPKIKKFGEEGFIKRHVDLGHSLKDVTDWVEYGRFSEKNLNRKLDFDQIKKTMEKAKKPVKRYGLLFKNKNPASAVIAESKALIKDIEQLRATEPYLKQADYENGQVPHSSALSNTGDEM